MFYEREAPFEIRSGTDVASPTEEAKVCTPQLAYVEVDQRSRCMVPWAGMCVCEKKWMCIAHLFCPFSCAAAKRGHERRFRWAGWRSLILTVAAALLA
eukprot:360374-Chlamydomonas_euryale.AAC.3